MSNSKFLYNNEGLCIWGVISVLEIMEELSYSKVMLIAPLIFNSKVVQFLGSNSIVRSLEEFGVKQNSAVSKFNTMYYNYIPIMINSLIILKDMDIIELKKNEIRIKSSIIQNVDIKRIGKRAKSILKIAPKIASILNEEEEKLYIQLGVIL